MNSPSKSESPAFHKYLIAGLGCVVLLGLLACSGGGGSGNGNNNRTDEDPKITNLYVSPERLCLNNTDTTVRVAYEIDPGDWLEQGRRNLCASVAVYDPADPENEKYVPNGDRRHKCWDEGTRHELTFEVRDIFPDSIPSRINVRVRLEPSIAGRVIDEEIKTFTTEVNCR